MVRAKKSLAILMAVMVLFSVFAVGASAANNDGAIVPISDDFADPGYIFCTGWEATWLNWILYYVFFGWIWMWW